jgi:hypothetical protein
MSDEDGIAQARTRNDEIRQYNQDVEGDKQQRVNTQRDYGNIAEEKLTKLLPEATDEQIAKFRRMGEDAAKGSMSEGDINKMLANEAKNYKNMIARIENSKDAPLALSKLKGSVLGTNREFESMKTNLRNLLKPLLDDGMYDTARMMLANKGYGPETIEGILGDLGEGSKKEIAQMPQLREPSRKTTFKKGYPTLENVEKFAVDSNENKQIAQTMQRSLSNDPGSNLILLRKGIMDKGGHWENFKDNLDEMIGEGLIQLSDDQWNQYSTLEEPPLDDLDRIVEQLNLIGK